MDGTLVLCEERVAEALSKERLQLFGAPASTVADADVDLDLEVAGADRELEALVLSPGLGDRPRDRGLGRPEEP